MTSLPKLLAQFSKLLLQCVVCATAA